MAERLYLFPRKRRQADLINRIVAVDLDNFVAVYRCEEFDEIFGGKSRIGDLEFTLIGVAVRAGAMVLRAFDKHTIRTVAITAAVATVTLPLTALLVVEALAAFGCCIFKMAVVALVFVLYLIDGLVAPCASLGVGCHIARRLEVDMFD